MAELPQRTSLTRRRLAALALTGVALVAVSNINVGKDFLPETGIQNYYADYVKGLAGGAKIHLNAPYAPYKGELEPRSSRVGRRAMEAVPQSQLRERNLANYNISEETGEVTCEATATLGPEEIPNVDFTNTIIVGYPGADKRTVLRQMEMLTGYSGRDSWDFQFLGQTNQPFIKTNYPHHEGIWGFGDHGDQVVLIIRNIRHTIDEYHDILSDINYAKTWVEATDMIPRLFKGDVIDEMYVRWRDERTMDEIGWYGWLIDYWMEGGILRDYFDHKLTSVEHWAKLREPETYTYGELQWDVNICATDVANLPNISYDEKCDPAYTADCRPNIIISAERLMDPTTGRDEHRKIAELLNRTAGVNETLVDEAAWDCMYDLLIANNTEGLPPENTEGYDDYRIREGVETRKHEVSTRHLNKMIQQLTRLINKYSAYDPETGIDWSTTETAQYLVVLLSQHRAEIQAELAATPETQVWAHPPKPNWVVFPMCGAESRRVWDYDYPHEFSGLVLDMFPDLV